MSDDNTIWQEWEGRIVPRQFLVGFVVLSYLISYVGAWTTLELFNQRTGGKGLYNWSLLFGSSVSMGGIAIWCMHYIGNRAIVLGGGAAVLQIAYSPGFTALSFFVPIAVLLVAFTALGSNDRVSILRVSIGGSLAGLAICGMHYLGQTGISNYACVYDIKNIVGAAVIAVVASIVALSVFFVLRATWTNSWWKRALCAILLAGAVSGMHWLASVGTQYRLRQIPLSSTHGNISRDSTIIVVIVLSIAACFVLLVFTMLAQRRRSRSANRAQQVVLASAVFDEDGRIMVTPEGLVPNRKVTSSNVERSLDGIFGTSHAVFHWIFRATRNWSSVSGLLPSMRNHVVHTPMYQVPGHGSTSEVNLKDDDGEATDDYSVIFRELFCVAAAELAGELTEPLENAGILFDEIFNTGQTSATNTGAGWARFKKAVQLEKGSAIINNPGRGLLLFLVRVVDRRTAEKLSAIGYRFADTQNVANIIARRMQINCNSMQSRLTSMYKYATDAHILKPGVHLACFAIRASVGGGFDVLVCKDARSKLPTIQLPFDNLEEWKINYLSQLNNKNVAECVKFLGEKSSSTEEELAFAAQLIEGITAMREEINHQLFADALLIAKPVTVPCSSTGGSGNSPKATLIAFRLLLPIQFRASGRSFEFVPLDFFKLQQYEYRNGVDGALFARMVHREFSPVLNKGRPSIDTTRKSQRSPKFLGKALDGFKSKRGMHSRMSFDVSSPTSRMKSDSSSERKLVETQTFGGIMVSQEVSVDIKEYEYGGAGNDSNDRSDGDGDGVEMVHMRYGDMGTSGRVTKEVENPETFVDTLFARCIENR